MNIDICTLKREIFVSKKQRYERHGDASLRNGIPSLYIRETDNTLLLKIIICILFSLIYKSIESNKFAVYTKLYDRKI